ncbi:MAG: C25 family cysteine peptidase [Candidatus Cloacimonetes bacterium]|nr:C25 family cysteine peptidase [Candidatus Cloacimonadota bacterium]
MKVSHLLKTLIALAFFIIFSFPKILFADIEISIPVESPAISKTVPVKNVISDSGSPQLQYIPVKILIPMSETVKDIKVTLQEDLIFSKNIYIEHVQEQHPISSISHTATPRNEMIYRTDSFFPHEDYRLLGNQCYKGYEFLVMNILPYKYNPVTRTLVYYKKINIVVETENSSKENSSRNSMLIDNELVKKEIASLVVNPDAIDSYKKSFYRSEERIPDINNPFQMIIITDQQREAYFQDFISWKNNQGIITGIFLTSEIYLNYNGVDNQDKIRNFIIDAYQTYANTETPLEYIFLGGDDEIIPIRGCYGAVGQTIDDSIPTDMYYSALDGNWNLNNNDIYGEPADNPDLAPELAIGRIPAETETEFQRFFQKNYHYVDAQSFANNIAYMYGEALDDITWGGDSKDTIIPYIPADFHVNTLYERENNYDGTLVKNSINFGLAIINHLGHSNENFVFTITGSAADQLINTDYGFAYSQGCYPAAFDEGTSQTSESVAERLVIAQGGLYAFIGNTRYGWYSPGTNQGASQFFDIAFFDALFTQNLRQLGKALTRSKIMLINNVLQNSVMRWCDYELILFGDPSISVKDPDSSFPLLTLLDTDYDDENGDNDGNVNPGETIDIYFTVINHEDWGIANNVTVEAVFENSEVIITNNSANLGSILPGETATSEIPVTVELPYEMGYEGINYSVIIRAFNNNSVVYERSFNCHFDINLMQYNWPWYNDHNIKSAPIVYDFNNDGSLDVIVSDASGSVNCLDYLANQQTGFPLLSSENILKSTAMADFNSDGIEDLVFASRNGRIYAVDYLGNELFSYSECETQITTPVIADLNNNDNFEIISSGIDKKVNVIDSNGLSLAGFPVELPAIVTSEIAAADLNNDGNCEILLGLQNGQLYAYDYSGNIVAGYPVEIGSTISSGITILENKKIAVGASDNRLLLLSNDGEILFELPINSTIANSPVLADINNDNSTDIIFVTANGYVYAVNQNGSLLPNFPVSVLSSVSYPPLIADIDGDSNLDIIVVNYLSNIYVFDALGNLAEFAPIINNKNSSTPSSIADIDNDGDLEIISGLDIGVLIIDSKYPAGGHSPWSTYRGSRRRTGYYGDTDFVFNHNNTAPTLSNILHQNYPNPFRPSDNERSSATTISFTLAEKGEVNISVFNVKGQLVQNLTKAQYNKGTYSVTWSGHNNAGSKVANGIYFYRLIVDGKETSVKKCLLLK